MSEEGRDPGDAAERQPDERRRIRRVPLEAMVHYQIDGSEFIDLSSDISADGIFIKNFAPPPVDTELSIKVNLPQDMGGHQVDLVGRVVRVADGVGSSDPGMGVEFTSIQARAPEAIRYFVSEVYEVDHIERLEFESQAGADGDKDYGGFRYLLDPSDALRLRGGSYDQPATGQAHLFTNPRRRLLWGALLVLIGILLGGGVVLVFFLGD